MALTVLNGPVIEAGQSLSAGLDCTAGEIVRLTMPAAWTGANLTFQISSDGSFYNDLFTIDGDEIMIPVVAGTAVVVAPLREYLRAVAFLKVRSGSREFPVVQAGQRAFAVALGPSEDGAGAGIGSAFGLTAGRIAKATGPDQIGDSAIADTGTAVNILSADGTGVIPASQPYGLAVTFNYNGYGEVDFWSLTNNTTPAGQGFYFNQKTGASTSMLHAALFHNGGTSSLELIQDTGWTEWLAIRVGPLAAEINGTKPLRLDYGAGFLFSEITTYITPGATLVINDSTTNVWGATITGGGANKVLAFYNGTNWTVLGK